MFLKYLSVFEKWILNPIFLQSIEERPFVRVYVVMGFLPKIQKINFGVAIKHLVNKLKQMSTVKDENHSDRPLIKARILPLITLDAVQRVQEGFIRSFKSS